MSRRNRQEEFKKAAGRENHRPAEPIEVCKQKQVCVEVGTSRPPMNLTGFFAGVNPRARSAIAAREKWRTPKES